MKTPDRMSPVKTRGRTDPKRQKAAEYVMSLSEANMLALVPEQAGLANTACPNCKGGRPNLANWEWTPQNPHQIRCKDCGEVYPNNPGYPDETSVAVEAPNGAHRYPYHHPPGNVRLFFRAKADYFAREYISGACQGLAEHYWTTEDERYARRGALILIRCAEVYPGYAYHYQYPGH